MNGSSAVPDPVVCVLSESAEPDSMSANTSPSPFSSSSSSSSSLPPNKSLREIILLMIPSAPSIDPFDFFGSSFFGMGIPRTDLASRSWREDGMEVDPFGRLDIPSPFNRRSAIPRDFFLPSLLITLFCSSSYKTRPGSALTAAWAAVVSGCQLA